jgi:hypothetical protein
MTKLRYVLCVEPEDEPTLISVHSTKAAAEAELRKFAAEFLDDRVPLVACRIFECRADGRPGAEATSLVLQLVLTQLKQAGLIKAVKPALEEEALTKETSHGANGS